MDARPLLGVRWTLLAYGVDRVLGFATTIVLARLLSPSDFGLLTLGTLVVTLVNVFGGLGLGQTLIVRQDLGRRAQGCVLTLLIATGVVAAVLMAGLSPVAAIAFDAPRLRGILLALSVVTAFSGLNWFYATLVQRELAFRNRFVSVSVQVVVNSSVAIPLAALGAGVWSLVAGVVAGSAAYGATLVLLSPYRVRPTWDRRLAGELFMHGRGFLLQGVTGFLQLNVDYIIVGRALGTARLGFYSTAYRLGELPQLAIADPVSKVTFPSFARMWDRGDDILRPYFSSLQLIAVVACPVGVIMSGAADPFVRTLLGPKWLPAIGPVAVFGAWAALRVVQVTITTYLNAVGLAGPVGRYSLLIMLAHVPAVALAAVYGGITWVAWAMVGYVVTYTGMLVWIAHRRSAASLGTHWAAVRPVALACAAAWGAARAASAALPGAPVEVLVGAVALGVGVYVAVLWVVERRLLAFTVQTLGRALGRATAPAGS